MPKKPITVEIPSEFKRLFDTDWREAAIFGGRYSLKSHTVARVLLLRARMGKIRVGCFREFQSSIAESSHQLLSDIIKQYELADFQVTDKTIVNTVTGSDFLFKGLWNNEQSIKSIEGIDIGWVEEAQTISRESLEVLTPTIRKPKSQIIYTYNRIEEEDPIHVRLIVEGRPNTLTINVNYNIAVKYGMIPKVILNEIEDDKKNRPALYKHKWLGEPLSSERKIYKNWRMVDEIPHEARLERYGLDFGYTNDPTAIASIWYFNGGYILKEELYRKGMSNKDIANFFQTLPEKLIIADSAEPKSIDELRSYGLNVQPAQKGKDSVRQGIQLIQDQPISVLKSSLNLIKEYRGYLWDVDRNGKIINEPQKFQDHLLDGIRYAMSTLARIEPPKTYFDRIWAKELEGQEDKPLPNLGR